MQSSEAPTLETTSEATPTGKVKDLRSEPPMAEAASELALAQLRRRIAEAVWYAIDNGVNKVEMEVTSVKEEMQGLIRESLEASGYKTTISSKANLQKGGTAKVLAIEF